MSCELLFTVASQVESTEAASDRAVLGANSGLMYGKESKVFRLLCRQQSSQAASEPLVSEWITDTVSVSETESRREPVTATTS